MFFAWRILCLPALRKLSASRELDWSTFSQGFDRLHFPIVILSTTQPWFQGKKEDDFEGLLCTELCSTEISDENPSESSGSRVEPVTGNKNSIVWHCRGLGCW